MTPQFTLVAGERLKSKKLIGRLFDDGLSQFYYPFKLLYLLQSNEEHKEPLQFGISIPKKKDKIGRFQKQAEKTKPRSLPAQ